MPKPDPICDDPSAERGLIIAEAVVVGAFLAWAVWRMMA